MPKNKRPQQHATAVVSCPSVKNSIFVQVMYWETGQPVPDVDVTLTPTGASGPTNPKGVKQFKGLDDGAYDVHINIGALAKTYRIDQTDQQDAVAGGEEGVCVFFLYQQCSIQVVVVGADGANPALAGVGVNVASGANGYAANTAAVTGAADFPSVKPGQYKVNLQPLPGSLDKYYVPLSLRDEVVEVSSGAHVVKRIVLPLRPAPTLRIAALEIILVKRDYQDDVTYKAHRLAVYPGKTEAFDGNGLLEANLPGLWLYRAADGGVGTALPAKITNAELTSGNALYLEARQPSAIGGPSVLTLSLVDGTIPVMPAVTATVTCVRVQLDLHAYKAHPGGPDTAALSDADKIAIGRNLHLQDNRLYAGRALMVVRQAEPSDYGGDLVLSAIGARVGTFGNEVAAATDFPSALAPIANGAIGVAGQRYWLQGDAVSAALRDSGFTLSISALPGVEGDRVHITVVKVTVDVCDFRPGPGVDPVPISGAKKMGAGRFLHLQNGTNDHARAKVIVSAVEPAAFNGNLELVTWDVTADNSANPRLSLYAAEAGGVAQAHPCVIGASTTPATRWAEGSVMSPAALDTQLRLRVSDAEGWADRAALTVGKFFVTAIRFDYVAADIYYPRIPDGADAPVPSYLLAQPADRNVARKRFTPAQVRPAVGGWHWAKQGGDTIAPDYSWPAAYVRAGAANPPAHLPELTASFEIAPHVPGDIDVAISATSAPGLQVDPLAVTLQNGVAANKVFTISGLPATVARLNGIELEWNYLEPAHSTRHTVFVLDDSPRPANNDGGGEYLWEVLEWSCHWANGVTGHQPVLNAIWGHFNPVRPPPVHADTGLTYWKNQHLGVAPKQNLEDGIRSKNNGPVIQGAVSCKVFDFIFINCLTVQGIHAAEVEVYADQRTVFANSLGQIPNGLAVNDPPGVRCVFTDGGGRQVYTIGWEDTTIVGHGNINSPRYWANHWIAAIDTPAGWQFYDACYGEGPFACTGAPPAVGSLFNVLAYEPHTAASFFGSQVTYIPMPGVTVLVGGANIPLSGAPGNQPHLIGKILWRSY